VAVMVMGSLPLMRALPLSIVSLTIAIGITRAFVSCGNHTAPTCRECTQEIERENCGSVHGGQTCPKALIYCSEWSGWCGNSDAHKHGSTGAFDYSPDRREVVARCGNGDCMWDGGACVAENGDHSFGRKQGVRVSLVDNDSLESSEPDYLARIDSARDRIKIACPSLEPSVSKRVGRDPGSMDIVITMANFTTTWPLATDTDSEEQMCDPRATTDEYDGHNPKDKHWVKRQCDRESARPCCVQNRAARLFKTERNNCGQKHDGQTCPKALIYCSEGSGWCGNSDAHKHGSTGAFDYSQNRSEHISLSEIAGLWGTCVAPNSTKYGAGGCACKDCFDYRIRDRAYLFNEVG
jgi:hypothetical protein